MKRQEGFTLLELLVVLAILGILVGIVAMNIADLTETAAERGSASEREVVQTAIDTYNTQDVLVNGSLAITGTLSYVKIDVDDLTTYPFAKYLKTDTKYWYSYTAPIYTAVVTTTAP